MSVEVFIFNGKIYTNPRLSKRDKDRIVKNAWTAVCAKCGRRIIERAVWGGGPSALVLMRLWFIYENGKYLCEECV
ncbi:hypothetical protein [Pyrobaculum aerophilum]|uniref:hypothetical protein n=1 Tax=Pyrobaculum aerophilum TaxID=13773 RepID=UPI0023F4C327|nr:hypothetical protein [Pyrobaculum aerophilum]MCX8137979.1 hypothetical protein [Pyrobaculum aerophilum]